jgi:hypothetical protein
MHHAAAGGGAAPAGVPPQARSRAYWLLSLTLSTGAFVFTGAMVHMIEFLHGLGHDAAAAVFLASLIGLSRCRRVSCRPPRRRSLPLC